MTDDLASTYAKVPAIECKGLCSFSCGSVPVSRSELVALRRADPPMRTDQRFEMPVPGTAVLAMPCSALVANRCAVYERRPLLCRLWGAVERLRCPFGCIPERYMSEDEVMALMREVGLL